MDQGGPPQQIPILVPWFIETSVAHSSKPIEMYEICLYKVDDWKETRTKHIKSGSIALLKQKLKR